MTPGETKLKPMPDKHFKGMVWWYKLTDFIRNPKRHLKRIPLKEGTVVVDYGCGPGRYTLPISKLIGPRGKVFAVDIQPLAIRMIKEKATQESLTNIEAVLLDSYDTGIQSSSADLVLLLDTLHEIGDYDVLFREIHCILKPDGTLFMDPGHMKMAKAREIVEGTKLFTVRECQNNDMVVTPKDKQ